MKKNISVLLTTEGTYPFSQGGVSTWCDMLVKQMKSVDFTVFSVLMDPFVTQNFSLPKSTDLIKVPLWGTEEPNEHLNRFFSTTLLAKLRTSDRVIKDRFLPLFRKLIHELLAREKNAFHTADILVQLYDLFEEYDYKLAFKSKLTWDAYKEIVLEAVRNPNCGFDEPDIYCLIQSLGWVYRFFNIINTPIPRTTITHSSAAAFCALPCVIAKLKYNTPFILTEHGVYLREQYLSLSKRGYPSFLNTFLIRMIHTVTHLSYVFADQISPVCEYNTRWEREMTGRHERIEVIYNGVDHHVFTQVKQRLQERPTVVTVARIDPIKDLLTLIRAARAVRERIPNVKFLIYGSTTVPEYLEQCLALRRELGLEETVEFCGHSSNPADAYQRADVVALTSISEGFPYSVIEAMLAAKPVVSTDVGGISEAVGDSGVLVPPMNPQALANGLVQLLKKPDRGQELGLEGQERALSLFTLKNSLEQYLKSYLKLAVGGASAAASKTATVDTGQGVLRRVQPLLMDKLQLYAERAHALGDIGELEAAYDLLKTAVKGPQGLHAIPVLFVQLADLAGRLGRTDEAVQWLEQSELLSRRIATERQQLHAERAYTLVQFGRFQEAQLQLLYAIQEAPESQAVPVLYTDLSRISSLLGRDQEAALEQDKAYIVSELLRLHRGA